MVTLNLLMQGQGSQVKPNVKTIYLMMVAL
jgi:hypothetical protein